MAGVGNIVAGVTSGITAVSNLLLVSPQQVKGYQPQNQDANDLKGLPPALLFNYEGEQSAISRADITDHFSEENISLQDQIALKPVIITTNGFIGELNNVAPVGLQTLQALANKMTFISAYTPIISETALIAYNEAAFLYATTVNAAKSLVNTFSFLNNQGGLNVIGSNGLQNPISTGFFQTQTQQQIYYQQFYFYQQTRRLFTVQTPWAIFQNMAIESLRSIQDAETDMVTDFELTFKQMRFASTSFEDPTVIISDNADGRTSNQADPLVRNGPQNMTPDATTTLSGQVGAIV